MVEFGVFYEMRQFSCLRRKYAALPPRDIGLFRFTIQHLNLLKWWSSKIVIKCKKKNALLSEAQMAPVCHTISWCWQDFYLQILINFASTINRHTFVQRFSFCWDYIMSWNGPMRSLGILSPYVFFLPSPSPFFLIFCVHSSQIIILLNHYTELRNYYFNYNFFF